MKVIRVFEYSVLHINNNFDESKFNQLVKFNEVNRNKYFDIGHRKVYFKNYVGVLQIGNLVIEILPKVDKSENVSAKDKWHNALIYMLNIAGYISIDSLTRANLNLQKITLIDLFYKVFIEEVRMITRTGLIRKYHYNVDNRPYLKGRILFAKHILRNLLHKELFFTSAQVYDQNNDFNKIIAKALNVLKKNNKTSIFVNEINNLLLYFDDVGTININDEYFERLCYTRNTVRYKDAINLARMILQNYSPDLNSGKNNIIGLLFDMNYLFEKTVYRLIKLQENRFKDVKLKLSSQVSKKFWNSKTIRPDIIAKYQLQKDSTSKTIIFDTKWKTNLNGLPSDDDLKQMYTYNVHFGALQSILIYPKCDSGLEIKHDYHTSQAIQTQYTPHCCGSYYINLFDDNGNIYKDAGYEVLSKFLI